MIEIKICDFGHCILKTDQKVNWRIFHKKILVRKVRKGC